jgi:hypothetical protein
MTLTSVQLLELKRPEELFPGDLDAARKKYYGLAKYWHPDTCSDKDATLVFQHLKVLYDEAVQKLQDGTWQGRTVHRFAVNGNVNEISFEALTSHLFELGIYYVGNGFVTYLLDKQHKDFWTNAKIRTAQFKYASPHMEKEVSRYLPTRTSFFELKDGRFGMTVLKDPEFLLLRDVLAYYKSLDPKHIAWIQSTLHNLACYLSYAELVHHEISLDTYFISPKNHIGALLGGWFYAKPNRGKLEHVSNRTFLLLPWEAKNKKTALRQTDLELIRCVGRELAGSQLNTLPSTMQKRLRDIATNDALKEYSEWRKCLEESYGKRSFTEMKLDAEILYRRI